MTYRHFSTRTEAEAWLYTMREAGQAGYILKLNSRSYLVRTW